MEYSNGEGEPLYVTDWEVIMEWFGWKTEKLVWWNECGVTLEYFLSKEWKMLPLGSRTTWTKWTTAS